MGTTSFPETPLNADLERVIINQNTMAEELDHVFGGKIDTKNIREISGWVASRYKLQSKDGDVGFNTEDTVADDIRIWAGDSITGSPSFVVTKSGKVLASNAVITGTVYANAGVIGGWNLTPTEMYGSGTITGGTVRTGGIGTDRIELSGGKLRGITSSGSITGLFFDIGTYAGTGIADLFLYHNGSKLLQLFDEISNYRISGMPGGWMSLGSASSSVFASGSWSFSGTVTGIPISGITGLQSQLDNIWSNISSLWSNISYIQGQISSLDSRVSALE